MNPDMTIKLNLIKSALRESIEIASKATEGPWEAQIYPSLSDAYDDGMFDWAGRTNSAFPSKVGVVWQKVDNGITGLPGSIETNASNANFIAHARTMTPLACKALLTAIEGLETMVCDPSHGGEMCSNEGWGCPACEAAKNTLESITSTWPDA